MNKILIIVFLMPFVVLGQTYHERALEILPSTPLEIIHIEENGTDIKAFIVEKKMVEAGKWANQEEPLYPINLFHVVDMNAEGTKNIESYVLDQFIFPKNQNITFRKGRVTYGESSTIRTYAELIEMYPQLSQVKRIDFENRVMPGAYYKGDLRTGSLNDKIKGFRVTQLTKAAANSTAASKPKAKKKKKGLMGKVGGAINAANSLGNKNAGRTPTYGVADEVDLNWENSYNGGQDKKNHWKCKMSALCPTTGNLLAFNVYQKKGEDLSQAQTQEVILFSPKGEIISKHDLNNDIPWELKDKVAHYSDTEDGGKKLEHASLIFTQVTGKKYKEGKDNMLRVLTINNSGEIVYDHTYELENRIGTIFNSTTSDGHKVIINNHYHKNLAYFIVESSPAGQAQATITTEKKEKRLEFEAYILSEQQNYIVFKQSRGLNAETAFLLYPFKQGQIEERIELIADKDDCTIAGFDVLINSGENLIVQTKELIPGINGFDKYPVARMDHYKITANKAVQLNDYSAQPIYLLAEDMEEYGGITQVGDTYYFISANFFPSEKKKNKLLKGRKLSSFQL